MQRSRVTLLEIAVLTASLVVYSGITAQAGNTTINLPLPSGSTLIWGSIVALFAEVGRRILRRLDSVVDSCSTLGREFTEFKSIINTALMGIDEQGGLLQNDRETRARVDRLERGEYQHARQGEDAARPHRRADDHLPEMPRP